MNKLDGIQTQTRKMTKEEVIQNLHIAADSQYDFDFSQESMNQQMSFFSDVMEDSAQRMELLGINQIMINDDPVTATKLRKTYSSQIQQNFISQDKEASYNEKNWKQERAAKRRGEYSNYPTGQMEYAQDVRAMYSDYQEKVKKEEKVKNYGRAVGNEFILAPDITEEQQQAELQAEQEALGRGHELDSREKRTSKEKILCVMLERDKLKNDLVFLENKLKGAPKHADPKTEIYKKYYLHIKQRMAVTKDALDTWYKAQGITENGKKVSAWAQKKAIDHLDLALEKYSFVMSRFWGEFGADMIKVLKETPEFAANKSEQIERDDAIADRDQVSHGMSVNDEESVLKIQRAIAASPDAYQANKEVIDKLFAKIVANFRKCNDITQDVKAANRITASFATSEIETNLFATGTSNYIWLYDAQRKTLNFQASAMSSYIRFLLTGRKADTAEAEYIRRQWGEDAAFDLTLQQREDQLLAYKMSDSELVKGHKHMAADKLRTAKSSYAKSAAMEFASDYNLEIMNLQDHLKFDEQGNVRPGQLGDTTGYRDLVRAYTPFLGKVTMTPQQLDTVAETMSLLRSGKHRQTNEAASKEEIKTGFLTLFPQLKAQADDMKKYMNDHPEIFEKRDQTTLLSNYEHLSLYYKKAQAIRDSLKYMRASKAVALIEQKERDELAEASIFCNAACEMCLSLTELIEKYSDKPESELLSISDEEFEMATYSYNETESLRNTIKNQIDRAAARGAA